MSSTRQKIFSKIQPKLINKVPVNNTMFLQLAKSFIEMINSGNMPNIDSAWNYIVKTESYKAYKGKD